MVWLYLCRKNKENWHEIKRVHQSLGYQTPQQVWELQKMLLNNKSKMCNIPVRLRRKSSPFLSKIEGSSAIQEKTVIISKGGIHEGIQDKRNIL